MKVESSFASQLYAAARRVAPPEQPGLGAPAKPAQGDSFAEALAAAVGELSGTLRGGEVAARQALLGAGDVQSVVEALTATELALETAVAVRDRVVEAYQEILRMPV